MKPARTASRSFSALLLAGSLCAAALAQDATSPLSDSERALALEIESDGTEIFDVTGFDFDLVRAEQAYQPAHGPPPTPLVSGGSADGL